MIRTLFSICTISLALALPTKPSTLQKRTAAQEYLASSPPVWYSSDSLFLSLDNNVDFYMQVDGNFVVYGPTGSDCGPVWSSGSSGHSCDPGNCWLQFQGDGNLVAYENPSSPTAFWSTGTNTFTGHPDPAYKLLFQNANTYVLMYDESGQQLVGYSYGENGFAVETEPEGSPANGPGGGGEGCDGDCPPTCNFDDNGCPDDP